MKYYMFIDEMVSEIQRVRVECRADSLDEAANMINQFIREGKYNPSIVLETIDTYPETTEHEQWVLESMSDLEEL